MQTDIVLRNPAQAKVDVERWFFTGMAGLLLVTALVGFMPRSAAILSGILPNPPLSVHIHAALMATWLLLLLTQSGLVASGKRLLHIVLGLSTFLLVPAIVVTMVLATMETYALMQAAGAGDLGSNILILQIRSVLLFPTLFLWGFFARYRDKATHKRMMLMCTFVVIDAAVSRMNFLPGNDITQSFDMTFLYTFLLLIPALAYDKVKLGRIHAAYLYALALYLPFIVLTSLLWSSAWWLQVAPSLLGF